MKKSLLGIGVLAMCVSVQAQTKTTKPAAKPAAKPAPTAAAALKTTNDSLSYAFGVSLGSYLKSQDIKTINFAVMNKAIDQTLKGQPTTLDMNAANQLMGRMAEEKSRKASGAEKEKGIAFLAQNKKRSGVVETATGLQYEIITAGTGPKPTAADTIVAHYRGTLINGNEFDNSYSRGEPITIPVSGVIAGWTEALQLMPVGSKWKLFIPSALAYGDYGPGPEIPGGATLVFDVELLSIKGKADR
ncbi:FKBP-type peptidyl-prolyl cis-trans isomerase [Aridibaculum aurantiacum]|uniref:FKBP-type peptidyl-prolyl cis-trans isomerase n=1 Tax=Aridibaculum aurantiacum TaxID=2810307 RepID=UPI001A9591FD|nr:FKBP-type peptidyl-prolyl cis-trans isomerase [Aridibaculum aurantiacum]